MKRPVFEITILAIIASVLFIGCAKNIGQSGVSNTAVVIEVTSETLVDEGLRLLQEHDPEAVNLVIADLKTVVAQIVLYQDGQATVGEFVTTFSAVLERINERAEVIDSKEAARLLRIVSRSGRIIEQYFDTVDLPLEVSIYADALATGIVQGMKSFIVPAAPSAIPRGIV